jgi:hypothetical protein
MLDTYDSQSTRSIMDKIASRFHLPFSFYAGDIIAYVPPIFLDSGSLDGSATLPPKQYVRYHGNGRTGWGGYRNPPESKVRVSIGDINAYVPMPKKQQVELEQWVVGEQVDGVWVGGGYQKTGKFTTQRIADDEYWQHPAMRRFLSDQSGTTYCTLHVPGEAMMRGTYDMAKRVFTPDSTKGDKRSPITFYPEGDVPFAERVEQLGTRLVAARTFYADKQIEEHIRKARKGLRQRKYEHPAASILQLAIENHRLPSYFMHEKIVYVTKGYLENGTTLSVCTRQRALGPDVTPAAKEAQELYVMLRRLERETAREAEQRNNRQTFPTELFQMADSKAYDHSMDMNGSELLAFLLGECNEDVLDAIFIRRTKDLTYLNMSNMPVIEE